MKVAAARSSFRAASATDMVRVFALATFLSGRFDCSNAYIIASSPRSGSTLLSQTLSAIPNTCVLFEPLHLKHVPLAKHTGFSWRTYLPPDVDWPEGAHFLKRAFEGKVINKWTAREMRWRDVLQAQNLIVKFVRINRLLPWLCRHMDIPAPILLLRHPCAVVASQLNFGWEKATRPEVPEFLRECPRFKFALSSLERVEEFIAAHWALDQLPGLWHLCPRPWVILTYEELLLRPETTLERIAKAWKLDINFADALTRINRPSSVVSRSGISGISGWRRTLSDEQVSRILQTVNSFGLSFYSRDDEADYGNLYGIDLASSIEQASR